MWTCPSTSRAGERGPHARPLRRRRGGGEGASPRVTRSPRRRGRRSCATAATRWTPRWRRCSRRSRGAAAHGPRARAATCSSPAPGREPELLDFFVAAPGRGGDRGARRWSPSTSPSATPCRCSTSAPASCGVYGTPAGVGAAAARYGTRAAGRAVRAGRGARPRGRPLNAEQAYLFGILEPIVRATPESRALFMPDGPAAAGGRRPSRPELGDALERLGAEGPAPFYTGDIAAAVRRVARAARRAMTAADLAGYGAVPREPVRVGYRGREVLTNPPPSAGGILIALRARAARARAAPPTVAALVGGDGRAPRPSARPRSSRGSPSPASRALPGGAARLHDAHLGARRATGWACSVTCTNGEGSGVVVPGTGHAPQQHDGRAGPLPARLLHPPAGPAAAVDDGADRRARPGGEPELGARLGGLEPDPLGDRPGDRQRASTAGWTAARPSRRRGVHFEDGIVYAEPGSTAAALEAAGHALAPFRDRNLFFGGVQAVGATRRPARCGRRRPAARRRGRGPLTERPPA